MPNFLRTPSADHRPRARRWSAITRCSPHGPVIDARADDGFTLLEVIITAFIVGLIVVATFTGFSVVSDKTADQRRHSQANELAAESQEQLRSDPANTLEALEGAGHSYIETLNGTKYTITETAESINDATQGSTCVAPSSTEAGKTSSSYLQITSVVSWASLEPNHSVEQSSIVTPPTGSSLELSAVNGASPAEGVANVSGAVEYTGVESTSPTKVEGTTGSLGCVVFGSIPATAVVFTLKPPVGYVNPAGVFTFSPEPVTLAPNITSHKEYTLGDGGTIKGTFTYNSSQMYNGKPVEGETFVAFNSKMGVAPEFTLASPNVTYEATGEQKYIPASTSAVTSVETPKHSPGYPTGNLFPWPTSDYVVYAGDCTANNVTASDHVEAIVKPGMQTPVEIPLSQVTLNVYSGTSTTHGSPPSEALPVQITDTACKGITPNNATKGIYVHTQHLTVTTGHLENPLQPYGAASLCVYYKGKNYTVSYTNENAAGSIRNIYLGSGNGGEQTVVSTSPTTPEC
jgi:prepilin-type N-terminal cleavage/methylation domain-containing protein